MALMLPADGKVFALDIDETVVNHGKPFFQEAGVSHKIDIRIGPAKDSMDVLINEGITANTNQLSDSHQWWVS